MSQETVLHLTLKVSVLDVALFPAAAITSDVVWENDGVVTVTWTASDGGSGINTCTLTISDGQTASCTGGDGTADFTMADGVDFTANIAITDVAGNSATSNTDTFSVRCSTVSCGSNYQRCSLGK
jgi:hypothetical protein